MSECVCVCGGGGVVAGESERSNQGSEALILFLLGNASSILAPPKQLSVGKFSHCFQEGPLPGQKSRVGKDEVGELRVKRAHGSGS